MSKSLLRLSTRALLVGSFLLTAAGSVRAGTEERVNKEVATQVKEPFPFHFSLTAGINSDFVFRGVNILGEKVLDLQKASDIAINSLTETIILPSGATLPTFPEFLKLAGFAKTDDFVKLVGFNRSEIVSRDSGVGYFDFNTSYTHKNDSITVGGFYALQTRSRTAPSDLGGVSFFTEYRELDIYTTYSHNFGPVTVSLGGTYYHVDKNSNFDTAEMNFGVFYTPPQLKNYVTFSLTYDYARAFNYDADDLDGHHIETKISGAIPVPIPGFKKGVVSFNPYVLVSAGAGIVPRAFNRLTLPTYFSNELFGAALAPAYQKLYNDIVLSALTGGSADIVGASTTALAKAGSSARAAVNPSDLDRDLDLSNFQVGFKVPIYITRYLTLTPNANYSRPLGNLHSAPYNQQDVIWGGGELTLTF